MDKARFARGMLAMTEAFGATPMSELGMEFFARAMSKYSDDEIEDAMVRATERFKFRPKPAELIELINENRQKLGDTAELAWEELYNAIARQGPRANVNFSDPKLNRIVRLLGGWDAVCQWEEKEIQWRRKEFLEYHANLPECDFLALDKITYDAIGRKTVLVVGSGTHGNDVIAIEGPAGEPG